MRLSLETDKLGRDADSAGFVGACPVAGGGARGRIGSLAAGTVSDFLGAAVWGLALLVSFVGWGSALLRVVRQGRSFGWGVRAALGMSCVVALGGVLQFGLLMSPTGAAALLVGGLAALGWARWQRREPLLDEAAAWPSRVRAAPWFSLLITALYCCALFRFLGSVVTPVANQWDDFEGYFVLSKALLAGGALDEPFSMRRLFNLGGHSFLQSLQLSGTSPARLNSIDSGLCLLSIFGMVDG